MKRWLLLLLLWSATAWAADTAELLRDRAAIERVYYNHRLGQKPPFEEVLAPATLEGLVRLDLKKEAVLRKAYGVTMTPALLDPEVQRINTTTRAPDMLAEIKAALGNDPARTIAGGQCCQSRNPKAEGRSKPEIRSPKPAVCRGHEQPVGHPQSQYSRPTH
jgi:hypothetical protein